MPSLLYIDTSGNTALVARSENAEINALRRHENAREQAAVLPSMIEEVVSQLPGGLSALDGICVCAGPGSYTGLRVSLSAAKGICYALDKPLLLFNRLDLLAAGHDELPALCIALTARTGEYFYAAYQNGNCVAEPQHIMEAALVQKLQDEPQWVLLTDASHLPAAQILALNDDQELNMEKWAVKALQRFEQASFDDLAYSEPFYLKAAYTTQSKK